MKHDNRKANRLANERRRRALRGNDHLLVSPQVALSAEAATCILTGKPKPACVCGICSSYRAAKERDRLFRDGERM